MMILLLASLSAQADVAIPPPSGKRFTSHALRVEGFDAHPGMVLLAYDPGSSINTHRSFSMGGQDQQDLARGGRNRGGGMGGPGLFLVSAEAAAKWDAATETLIDKQRQDCHKGIGCAHISRFVASYPPPEGAIDCGYSVKLQLEAPESGPDSFVDVVKLSEASATACKVEFIRTEAVKNGEVVGAAKDAAEAAEKASAGCATVTGAASLMSGLVLLLGLARRRESEFRVADSG